MSWHMRNYNNRGGGSRIQGRGGPMSSPKPAAPRTYYKIYTEDYFLFIDQYNRRDPKFAKDAKDLFTEYTRTNETIPPRRTTVWSTVSPKDTSISGFHMWHILAPGHAEHQMFLWNALTCPSEIYTTPPRHLVLIASTVDNAIVMVNQILNKLGNKSIEVMEFFIQREEDQVVREELWTKMQGHQYRVSFTNAHTYRQFIDQIALTLRTGTNPFTRPGTKALPPLDVEPIVNSNGNAALPVAAATPFGFEKENLSLEAGQEDKVSALKPMKNTGTSTPRSAGNKRIRVPSGSAPVPSNGDIAQHIISLNNDDLDHLLAQRDQRIAEQEAERARMEQLKKEEEERRKEEANKVPGQQAQAERGTAKTPPKRPAAAEGPVSTKKSKPNPKASVKDEGRMMSDRDILELLRWAKHMPETESPKPSTPKPTTSKATTPKATTPKLLETSKVSGWMPNLDEVLPPELEEKEVVKVNSSPGREDEEQCEEEHEGVDEQEDEEEEAEVTLVPELEANAISILYSDESEDDSKMDGMKEKVQPRRGPPSRTCPKPSTPKPTTPKATTPKATTPKLSETSKVSGWMRNLDEVLPSELEEKEVVEVNSSPGREDEEQCEEEHQGEDEQEDEEEEAEVTLVPEPEANATSILYSDESEDDSKMDGMKEKVHNPYNEFLVYGNVTPKSSHVDLVTHGGPDYRPKPPGKGKTWTAKEREAYKRKQTKAFNKIKNHYSTNECLSDVGDLIHHLVINGINKEDKAAQRLIAMFASRAAPSTPN